MIEKFELYKYSDYAASDYAWSTVVLFIFRMFLSEDVKTIDENH